MIKGINKRLVVINEKINEEHNLANNLKNKALILELLNDLTEKQRFIIKLRFGIVDKFDCSKDKINLENIGKMLDPPISKERVRQIENEALDKLKENISTNYAGIIENML